MTAPFKLTVRLDLPLVDAMISQLRQGAVRELFPRTLTRFGELAQHGASRWIERAMHVPGRTGRPLRLNPYVGLDKPELEKSIHATAAHVEGDRVVTVIFSTSPQAALVEDGTPGDEMDLHSVLPHATKARKSKAGHLYLRIPFRHATQSAEGGPVLPSGILAVMKTKPRYLINRLYQEPQITPWRPPIHRGIRTPFVSAPRGVTRFGYTAMSDDGSVRPKPEARLTRAEAYAVLSRRTKQYLLTPEQRMQQAQRLEGMMHVGRQRHGQYLTIRTMSQAEPAGWRVSPYPGQRIAEATKAELAQLVQDGFFDDALKADVAGWVRLAGQPQ